MIRVRPSYPSFLHSCFAQSSEVPQASCRPLTDRSYKYAAPPWGLLLHSAAFLFPLVAAAAHSIVSRSRCGYSQPWAPGFCSTPRPCRASAWSFLIWTAFKISGAWRVCCFIPPFFYIDQHLTCIRAATSENVITGRWCASYFWLRWRVGAAPRP